MQNVFLLGRDFAELEEYEIIALRARLGRSLCFQRIEAKNVQELIAAAVYHDTKVILLPPRPRLGEALFIAIESRIARKGVTVYAFSERPHGECLCKLTPAGKLEFAWDSPPKAEEPKLCLV